MKNILISSFDMEVGGVERSLISMLDNFDYQKYNVNIMLYSHSGDFMNLLPTKSNILKENKKYKTFRMGIGQILKNGELNIGLSRLRARYKSNKIAKKYNIKDSSYLQMQYMWKYTLPYLPLCDKEYDVAISYLWPHYYIADKVKAKTKIAWIHTDYSTIYTDIDMDIDMWSKFDYIISISDDCSKSFLAKYPSLESKIVKIENINSPKFVQKLSEEQIYDMPNNKDIFKIVSVGRYCDAKGFDNAIQSMTILKDRGYMDIRWYIVGYGSDEEKLKTLIEKNDVENEFILLGKRINPYPYMRQADIYVQPSRYEGKAVTVTEAQILGKPVMITNYTTAKSQVSHGIDGYICELSIDGIADGIERLYKDSNLRNKLASNCNKTDYSNSYELDKLYELFNT